MNLYQADIDRYRSDDNESDLSLILRHQGLWALGVHRLFHPLVTHQKPLVRKLAKPVGFIASKWIEIIAGIALNPRTSIGAGLYLGHFGGIIIHPDAKIGSNCVIMQGVTIGNSGKVSDPSHHAPQLGDRVYVGTGAVVTGYITLGDDSVVGANAVLNKPLEARAVAVGAPAQVVSHKGSFQYIHYRGMDEDQERLESLKRAKHAEAQALIQTQPLPNKRDTATMYATMGSHP
jgi:serine O-acetyltransferase